VQHNTAAARHHSRRRAGPIPARSRPDPGRTGTPFRYRSLLRVCRAQSWEHCAYQAPRACLSPACSGQIPVPRTGSLGNDAGNRDGAPTGLMALTGAK